MAALTLDPVEDLALSTSVALSALCIGTPAERAGLPCVTGHSPNAPKIAMMQATAISPSMIKGIMLLPSSAVP